MSTYNEDVLTTETEKQPHAARVGSKLEIKQQSGEGKTLLPITVNEQQATNNKPERTLSQKIKPTNNHKLVVVPTPAVQEDKVLQAALPASFAVVQTSGKNAADRLSGSTGQKRIDRNQNISLIKVLSQKQKGTNKRQQEPLPAQADKGLKANEEKQGDTFLLAQQEKLSAQRDKENHPVSKTETVAVTGQHTSRQHTVGKPVEIERKAQRLMQRMVEFRQRGSAAVYGAMSGRTGSVFSHNGM